MQSWGPTNFLHLPQGFQCVWGWGRRLDTWVFRILRPFGCFGNLGVPLCKSSCAAASPSGSIVWRTWVPALPRSSLASANSREAISGAAVTVNQYHHTFSGPMQRHQANTVIPCHVTLLGSWRSKLEVAISSIARLHTHRAVGALTPNPKPLTPYPVTVPRLIIMVYHCPLSCF